MSFDPITAAGARKLAKSLVVPLVKASFPCLISRATASLRTIIEPDVTDLIDGAGISSCFERLRGVNLQPAEFEKFFRSDAWASIATAAAAAAALGDKTSDDGLADGISLEIQRAFPKLGAQRSEQMAAELTRSLRNAADLCWSTIRGSGAISPVEAASESARQIFMDEVEAARRRLRSADTYGLERRRIFEQYAGKYLRALGTAHQKLTPPSTADSIQVDIDKIYVPCDFIAIADSVATNADKRPITYHGLLSTTYRTVVLGTPGAGKSTFLRKLCYDLWHRPQQCPIGAIRLIPVLIVLRDYGRRKKEQGLTILEYARQAAKSDLQLDDIPDGFFDYLIASGRALFLFDGLDELIEIADRISVRDAVERFAFNNPGVTVVVTTRQVGYEQAPLSGGSFRAYKLTSFSPDQVRQYCENWFALHGDRNSEERRGTVNSFMRESASVSDIRSNPLLLALMCNLYKQDGYLPRNRPNVYSRCADLLFEKWDRHRGIRVGLSAEHLLRSAIMSLAHWIYSDSKLREGVSEGELIRQATTILSKHFDTAEESEQVARAFVEFCRGRAWVFTDTGSSETEPLYQFTHSTFLEFFAAQYLVLTHKDLKSLVDAVLAKVRIREWDIVCQLAVQMKATGQQDGADDCISLLLAGAGQGEERANVLSFVARLLEFLYPIPSVRRRIADDCLDFLFVEASKDLRCQDPATSTPQPVTAEILPALMAAAEENFKTIGEEVERVFCASLAEGGAAGVGAAFVLAGFSAPHDSSHRDVGPESRARLSRLSSAIRLGCLDGIERNLAGDVYLASLAVSEGLIGVETLVEAHGIGALKLWAKFPFINIWRGPMGGIVLHWMVGVDIKNQKVYGATLSEIKQMFLNAPEPWPSRAKSPFQPLWIENPGKFMLPKSELKRSILVLLLFACADTLPLAPNATSDYERARALTAARDERDGEGALQACKAMGVSDDASEKIAKVIRASLGHA